MGLSGDPAISAIKVLSVIRGHPTYSWLKDHFGRAQISEDTYRSLNRGRAILRSVAQLDQYLFSYGPMIASQWEHVCESLKAETSAWERLVDYGCGQGLAGLLLSDGLGRAAFSSIGDIVAIEPSAVALDRASAIYHALAPAATITPINKGFDALDARDLPDGHGPTVHVFSNVLDVDGYDHVALLRKSLRPGKHTIIAVSHDRSEHGYSLGMSKVKDAIDTGKIHSDLKLKDSRVQKFKCKNRNEPAVFWFCEFEISDE